MTLTKKQIVLASPFLIIGISFGVAFLFKNSIGKWAFIPIILIQWCLFISFFLRYTDKETRKKWLQKSKRSFGWNILALCIGILPLPLFLMHYETLEIWQVWLPWILLAIINPWIEEFYWRGLLLEYTKNWSNWIAITFTSLVFACSHAVFGVNSELNSGFTVIISTFIMGIIWALVYKKTDSLRWIILAHFLVDFFNLSAASFLDLYEKGNW
ncbi:CPBP family intramembrane glutamic endopeptidase [Formosa sp. PL04]|uniref:CPBP family intramembrane glutamic endopeptidase n=1 Tax=Formosa sp. PL04 TaxID=3081755 RepID=UPI0029821FA6|nr:CPBP family intramembrane glutamic endopeptidase [Formosa sp. PL04]MDW5290347.1 CPBP family intramembrane glutamic endopeptidase [Formosa sp. PL04]